MFAIGVELEPCAVEMLFPVDAESLVAAEPVNVDDMSPPSAAGDERNNWEGLALVAHVTTLLHPAKVWQAPDVAPAKPRTGCLRRTTAMTADEHDQRWIQTTPPEVGAKT